MKLIKPTVEIIKQEEYDLDNILKFIELAGRTCYKSEDKITENSAKDFVDKLVKSGHGAMLEHGTVYLAIPITTYAPEAVNTYLNNSYSKVNKCNKFIFTDKYGDKVAAWCVTTNLRVLVENNCLEDLEFICEPTEYHEKRTTVKFICDRAVANEFVRHRVFSFAQESTRYCNYTKDKFNNELTFIIPCWINDIKEGNYHSFTDYHNHNVDASKEWYDTCLNIERTYFILIEVTNWKPQQARSVLPNSLKTELVMTGFDSDWQHFFELRCAANAHPQAKELADMLKDKMM